METLVEVELKHGSAIVSSKKVAKVFGKVHSEVMKSIRSLECSDNFRQVNFHLSSYTSAQNKVLPCYEMTKDGFSILAMGFNGKKAMQWKEAYINAFNFIGTSLLNVDTRMNQITIEQGKIKEAGSCWSKLGHEISQAKKANKALSDALVKDVQISLGFDS